MRFNLTEEQRRQASDSWQLGSYRGIRDEYDIEAVNGRELSGQRGMFASKADAELAAASPDMLFVLRGAYETLIAIQEGRRHSIEEAIEVSGEVLARAEGRHE